MTARPYPLLSRTLVAVATCTFLAYASLACGSENAGDNAEDDPMPRQVAKSPAPYDFGKPAQTIDLPPELQEISGLTTLPDGRLAAVNDEKGRVYAIGLDSGAVEMLIDFGTKGDYEGIERVGERLFVMDSDGSVVELTEWRSGGSATKIYDGGYGERLCNAEGLAGDPYRLILVCKEANVKEDNAMYAFELGVDTFAYRPIRYLDPREVGVKKDLRPSAAAVHPVTGQTMVLSSRYALIMVLNKNGVLDAVWDIKPAKLQQPEGMTFLENGDLVLASEGDHKPGRVVRYAYVP